MTRFSSRKEEQSIALMDAFAAEFGIAQKSSRTS
jgi:hypothetical protein